MTCTACKKNFSPDEIDLDNNCFDCANQDPDYHLDTTSIVKELIDNAIHSLSTARNIAPSKMKSDLVAEHVYKNPDKFIKEVVSSVTIKKKNVSQAN